MIGIFVPLCRRRARATTMGPSARYLRDRYPDWLSTRLFPCEGGDGTCGGASDHVCAGPVTRSPGCRSTEEESTRWARKWKAELSIPAILAASVASSQRP